MIDCIDIAENIHLISDIDPVNCQSHRPTMVSIYMYTKVMFSLIISLLVEFL